VMGHGADLDFARLAASPGTLVLFMGARSLPPSPRACSPRASTPTRPPPSSPTGRAATRRSSTTTLAEIADAAASLPDACADRDRRGRVAGRGDRAGAAVVPARPWRSVRA